MGTPLLKPPVPAAPREAVTMVRTNLNVTQHFKQANSATERWIRALTSKNKAPMPEIGKGACETVTDRIVNIYLSRDIQPNHLSFSIWTKRIINLDQLKLKIYQSFYFSFIYVKNMWNRPPTYQKDLWFLSTDINKTVLNLAYVS